MSFFSGFGRTKTKPIPHYGKMIICPNGYSLYLDVEEASGKVKTFPIHEYISEFGDDWKDRNLNDLNMLLEYTPVGVSITIRGWDQEIVIDVVI